MIIRVSIANLDVAEASKLGQASGFPGSVYPNVGFGAWGIEHGVTFEFAGWDALRSQVETWTRVTLAARGEQAAYLTVNGSEAYLLYADGKRESLAA